MIESNQELGAWHRRKSFSFDEQDLEIGRGILVQLYKAIPVPNRDVPLQDIMEFREKRRPELLALRHHLEDIYERVISAGDGELMLQKEIERLSLAIADQIKCSRQTSFPWKLAGLSAELNLVPPIVTGLGTAGVIAWASDQPMYQVALSVVPVLSSSLAIKIGSALKDVQQTRRHTNMCPLFMTRFSIGKFNYNVSILNAVPSGAHRT